MQNSTEGFRLSPQQKSLWVLQQSGKGHPYRAFLAISVEGVLPYSALERAITDVVQRHEILRTTFHRPPGIKMPFQIVAETARFSWQSADVSSLDATDQKERIAEYIARERERPFDFFQGPLLRVTLIKQSEAGHVLLVSLPALCGESATLANFTSEFSRAYASGLNQEELAPEPMQYADFAEWQLELFEADDEHALKGKGHWRDQQAAGAPSPVMPMEKRVVQAQEFLSDSIAINLDSLLAKIEALAQEQATSVSAVLFAGWQALLWRLAGETKSGFALYNLSAGRKFDDLTDALGLYAKYLPIACQVEDESFVAHLRRASNALNEVDEWQEYFDPGATAGTVGNSVAFDFEERQSRYGGGGLSFSVLEQYVCFSPFKLKLSCVRSGATLSAELYYDKQVFDREAVKQIAGYVERFLSGVLQDPKRNIGEIEIVGATELRRLLVDLNQTATEFAPEFPITKCVHQLFEAQAAGTPAAPALVSGDQELTYDELNTRANQLAHLLRRRGVGPDVCVGLCVRRSAEMIVGMLGILKAGGACVPLNPDHPQERLAMQLAESKSSALITNGGLDQALAFAGETIDLQRESSSLAAEPKHNPQSITTAENLVYVIYTSGSTGIPKGVAVRHRNLVNYTQSMLQRLDVDGPLAFATVSTISADLGNTCIFPALLSGGCLHVLGYDVAMEGDLLRDYIARQPIDVLKIVPSHLNALLSSQAAGLILPAKYLILGGEALSWDLVQRISRLDHSCRIINHYGPTETTVGSLTFSVDDQNLSCHSYTVPIGRPLANTRCYILDRRQRLVVPGAIGELYIGGAGVAAGYLNQPAETAARFVVDPFAQESGSRLYRTGDLARYLADGNIEFLGRADHQVKVRGYRVELGEIETVLSAHPGVRQAVVTVNRDQSGDQRIVAYVVSAPGSQDELRALLRQKLPDYMIPSAFVFLKSFPLTPNGKVDRAALPAPEDTRSGLQDDFVAPRTPAEEKLAGLWADLLKLKIVGVHDNFFDLGGHSLLATQVVSRMRKEFQMEIPLRSLFESPTVAALAEKIEGAMADDTARLLTELEQLSDDEASRLLGLENTLLSKPHPD